MKYLKYIISAIVVIIIIIIITMLSIMNGENYAHTEEIEDEILRADVNRNVSIVEDRNNYYVVKSIVQNYYYDLMQFNIKEEDILVFDTEDEETTTLNSSELSKTIDTEKQAYKNKVYNYLDEEYIEKNDITKDNIQSKLGNYNNVIALIDNMYYIDTNKYVRIYFIDGNVIEKETLKKEKFSMTIYVDSQNSSFKLYPSGYKYNIKLGEELLIEIEEIENNTFNKYTYKLIDNETYCLDIFNDYKNRLVYDIDSVYSYLDEGYRKAKFENINEFKNYISNNYYEFINSNIASYQLETMEDYERILFADRNGKDYIFKVTAPTKYTLILDTYTIEIPEFTKKYEASNAQERVILNINKFMQAVNDKDYKYAYSLLADSFKETNFKTQEEFENYIKTNFFEKNEFEYKKFGDEANTYYTYEVKVTDRDKNSTEEITKTFIVLLEEGLDFKLSFNK